MIDSNPDLRMLLTGSSSFDLYNQTGEPLTGRKRTFYLFPLALSEFLAQSDYITAHKLLAARMIYGSYPEVWQYQEKHEQIAYLKELANYYLLRDILQYEGIRNATKIRDLLRLIALQTGSEVAYDELGKQLSLHRATVEKYLDLLTKQFVLIKVEGFSRNLRKEIAKRSRWYFIDTGIRNVFANNFAELEFRTDVGALWENYCSSERGRSLSYQGIHVNCYFWRTYDQQEIDWIEEGDGKLNGFEFKWKAQKTRAPGGWQKSYPQASFQIIHPDNYMPWLLPPQ